MFKRLIFTLLLITTSISCRTTSSGAGVKDAVDGTNWCHARFTSTDQAQISVDYNIKQEGSTYFAKPVWVNVSRSGLSAGDSVRVVVVEKSYNTQVGSGNEVERGTYEFDLHYDEGTGKFTTDIPKGLVTLVPTGSYQAGYIHEFAVIINGTWLKDPVSGGSNFRTNLYKIHMDNGQTCYAR